MLFIKNLLGKYVLAKSFFKTENGWKRARLGAREEEKWVFEKEHEDSIVVAYTSIKEDPTTKVMAHFILETNLFKEEKIKGNTWIDNTGAERTDSGYSASDYIKVGESTLTVNLSNPTESKTWVSFTFFDEFKNYVGGYTSEYLDVGEGQWAKDVPEDVSYVRFSYSSFAEDIKITSNIPPQCIHRKKGTQSWIESPHYASKNYPYTDKMVEWFLIESLEPGTLYEMKLNNHRQVYEFKTFSENEDVKVLQMSDGVNKEWLFENEEIQGFKIIKNENPDLIIGCGDFVHDNGLRVEAWDTFFNAYQHFLTGRKRIPFIVAFGNHDGHNITEDGDNHLLWVHLGGNRENAIFYNAFFWNLENSDYGVTKIGNFLTLMFLNSGHTVTTTGEQVGFIERELAAAGTTHIFPFFHVGPVGGYYINTAVYTKGVINHWLEPFRQHGVKFVGNGHEHVNLVSKPTSKVSTDTIGVVQDGPVFVGQGHGLGNTTRGVRYYQEDCIDFLDISQKALNFITFKTSGQAQFKMRGLDGTVMYELTR